MTREQTESSQYLLSKEAEQTRKRGSKDLKLGEAEGKVANLMMKSIDEEEKNEFGGYSGIPGFLP